MTETAAARGGTDPGRTGDAPAAPSTRPAPKAKSPSLDALRAIAALSVVVFHYRTIAASEDLAIPMAMVGDLGVQVFFVLSGYLIATAVIAPKALSRRDYSLNRAFRILPLAWFAVGAMIALHGTSVLAGSDDPDPTRRLVTGAGDVVTHLLMIHGWFPSFRTSIIGPLWTLSIEWQFYAFILIVAGLLRTPRTRWILAGSLVVVGIVYRIWVVNRYSDVGDVNLYTKQLPGTIDVFAMGILAALAVRAPGFVDLLKRRWVALTGLATGLAGVACLLVVYQAKPLERTEQGFLYLTDWRMVVLFPPAFGLVVTAVMLCIQQFDGRLEPWVRWSGLGYIGLISYSIYVFHLPVFAETKTVAGWFGADPWGVERLVVSMGLVLVVSSLTYFFVERTAMALRRHMKAGGGWSAPELWRAIRPSLPRAHPR